MGFTFISRLFWEQRTNASESVQWLKFGGVCEVNKIVQNLKLNYYWFIDHCNYQFKFKKNTKILFVFSLQHIFVEIWWDSKTLLTSLKQYNRFLNCFQSVQIIVSCVCSIYFSSEINNIWKDWCYFFLLSRHQRSQWQLNEMLQRNS